MKNTILQQVQQGNFLDNGIFIGLVAVGGVLLIQLLFPPGTRTVSRRYWLDHIYNWQGLPFLGWIGQVIDKKYLREYRCPSCNKLLAKGFLSHKDSVLEVKCRNCATICLFQGEDAEIVEKRAEFLKKGIVPDTDEIAPT